MYIYITIVFILLLFFFIIKCKRLEVKRRVYVINIFCIFFFYSPFGFTRIVCVGRGRATRCYYYFCYAFDGRGENKKIKSLIEHHNICTTYTHIMLITFAVDNTIIFIDDDRDVY